MGDTLKTALRAIACVVVGITIGTLAYYSIQETARHPDMSEISALSNNARNDSSAHQQQALERSRRSTVQVLSAAPDHSLASQSGTYLQIYGRYFVITTAHGLLGDCGSTKIYANSTLHNCVYFTEVNAEVDYAIIEVEKLVELEPVRIPKEIPFGNREWKEELAIMSRVFYTGYPNSVGPLTVDGHVAGYDDEYVFLNSYAWSGSSGSGVFSKSGKYVGYVIAIDIGQTHYGMPQIIEDVVLIVPAFRINWESARQLPPRDTGETGIEVPETSDTANYSIVY